MRCHYLACEHRSCLLAIQTDRAPSLSFCAEFEADAKAKVTELAALLQEREDEYYAYQQSSASAEDDYDDEDEDEPPSKPKTEIDSIDYADDEDED